MTSHIVVSDLHIIIVCAIAYGFLLAEPAHCFGLASYRADAVAAVAGYTKRPSWQLPALRARPPLAVWASDDRLGTFVAGHPNAPPLAEDIYKLRLLDEEDQQSAEDQQQSGEVRVCFAVCMQTIDWLFLEAPVFCCAMGIWCVFKKARKQALRYRAGLLLCLHRTAELRSADLVCLMLMFVCMLLTGIWDECGGESRIHQCSVAGCFAATPSRAGAWWCQGRLAQPPQGCCSGMLHDCANVSSSSDPHLVIATR